MRSTRMITVEVLRHDLRQVHAEQKALAKEETWLVEQIAARAGLSKDKITQRGGKKRPSRSEARKSVADALAAADGPTTIHALMAESGVGQTAIGKYLREWIAAGTVRQAPRSIGKKQREYELVKGRSPEPTKKITLGATAPKTVDLKTAREQARQTSASL